MDVKAVVVTSMAPYTSSSCMAQHLIRADKTDVKVIAGKDIREVARAGIWIDEDLVGFPLREKCEDPNFVDRTHIGGMEDFAQMLVDSVRTDWVYI